MHDIRWSQWKFEGRYDRSNGYYVCSGEDSKGNEYEKICRIETFDEKGNPIVDWNNPEIYPI